MNRVLRAGLGIAATLNVAATVLYALDRDWVSAVVALALAAALTALAILHRPRPTPAPPQRGLAAITFIGGPVDGGTYSFPGTDRDLQDAELELEGTRYRVTTVHHTCYTAEVDQP